MTRGCGPDLKSEHRSSAVGSSQGDQHPHQPEPSQKASAHRLWEAGQRRGSCEEGQGRPEGEGGAEAGRWSQRQTGNPPTGPLGIPGSSLQELGWGPRVRRAVAPQPAAPALERVEELGPEVCVWGGPCG